MIQFLPPIKSFEDLSRVPFHFVYLTLSCRPFEFQNLLLPLLKVLILFVVSYTFYSFFKKLFQVIFGA